MSCSSHGHSRDVSQVSPHTPDVTTVGTSSICRETAPIDASRPPDSTDDSAAGFFKRAKPADVGRSAGLSRKCLTHSTPLATHSKQSPSADGVECWWRCSCGDMAFLFVCGFVFVLVNFYPLHVILCTFLLVKMTQIPCLTLGLFFIVFVTFSWSVKRILCATNSIEGESPPLISYNREFLLSQRAFSTQPDYVIPGE